MKEWHVIYSAVPIFTILDIVYCTFEEALEKAGKLDQPAYQAKNNIRFCSYPGKDKMAEHPDS